MERFHIIPDAECIVRSGGVFKQVKVFQRGGALFIGIAGGFVRLYQGGNTGKPNLAWDDIEVPGLVSADMAKDGLGKLSLPPSMKMIGGNAS